MPKYRIPVRNVEYGFIDVVADNLEDAEEKVYSFDGDYFVNKNFVDIDGEIETLEEQFGTEIAVYFSQIETNKNKTDMNRIYTDFFWHHMRNVQNCTKEIIGMMREMNVTEVDIPFIEEKETELSISRVYEDYYYTDYITKVKIEGEDEFTSIKVVDLDGEERWLCDYINEDTFLVYDSVFFILDKMKNHGKAE